MILSILILESPKAFGQISPLSNPMLHINQQMRNLFTPLTRPPSNFNYLYEMTGHVTDDKFWTKISYDTSSTDNWYRLYWEQFYMAYDTTVILHDEEIYENVLQYRGDTVPLGILDVSYYKFVSNALTSNKYFNFDTINDIINDITGRPTDPYIEENIFAFSPLYNKAKYSKITWIISPGSIFKDMANIPFYNPSQYTFQIDFGDGNGFQTFDPTITSYETIDYGALGYTNEIILNAQILQDGQLIKHSRSKFLLGKTGSNPRPYDEVVYYNEMPVYIYRACGSTPQNRKVVVYLEGIDIMDFIPKENRSAEDIYYSMLQVPNISQLSNFGYDFYIVDWQNSRIDMKTNAMSIVNLLDALKAEVQNDNEFVIIGESMGGVVARYALTYMESALYTDPNNWPNANRRERMHNCRLLITWDSPHQGANLPLSIQHMYDAILKLADQSIFGVPISTRFLFKNFNLFLDSKAAKQLLLYHIDTKSGLGLYKNYSEHSDRITFVNDLASLGNYPQFCKKMAVSNGALNGEMQTQFFSFNDRVANDKLLNFETELFAKILWFVKVPLMGANLELRTNPNGQGQVFQFNAGTWGIRLKFYWFGVKLITGYNSLFNLSEYADVNPYCVNSGGYFIDGLEQVVGQSTNSGTEWHLSRYSLLNLASFKSGSDGSGCWGTQAHVGFDGFASANFDLSICSDGLHFSFVPLQSALDYGTLNSVALNYNFEADLSSNPSLMNTNTPFDVIVANGATDINFLGTHNLNRGHLYVKYEGEDVLLEQQFPFRDCPSPQPGNGTGIFGHWVNREIGDDILYLDNFDCNRSSTFEAVYETFINTFNNPWYSYTNGNNGSRAGFYSKSNYFTIRDNTNADFRYDFSTHNPPLTINYIFNPAPNQGFSPFSGTWSTNNSAPIACNGCFDFGKKAKETAKKPIFISTESSFVNIYPNPNFNSLLFVTFNFSIKQPVKIILNDIQGKVVLTKNISNGDYVQTTNTLVRLDEYNIKKGLYFVTISNGIESFVKKLIIE